MLFCDISAVNRALEQDADAYVTKAETDFERKLQQAAAQVRANAEQHPIVLLSGPSGSGKTTSAQKIGRYLTEQGCPAHVVSMDNYFLGRNDGLFPLDDEGNEDLESPVRLDAALLSKHLDMLSRCEPVEMPSFDFVNQVRTNTTQPLERCPGEIVIFEGIHALNPNVTGGVGSHATGIYVSVRTRLTGEGGLVLHPEKIRLLRRLLRDSLYRGQSYYNTISRLTSVSRGEDLYIMPYKKYASINIDTLLPYELAVYRDKLLEGIDSLDDAFMNDMGLGDLKAILHRSAAFPMERVSSGSLLREFIGES